MAVVKQAVFQVIGGLILKQPHIRMFLGEVAGQVLVLVDLVVTQEDILAWLAVAAEVEVVIVLELRGLEELAVLTQCLE